MKNSEILGIAAANEETASVLVQMPDGTFKKMTPSQAKAHVEKEAKMTKLAIALRNFMERERQYKTEMELLHEGGSDPSGRSELRQILGRRSTQ